MDDLEYRLPEEVARPDFAAIKEEDDRFIARSMHLKKGGKYLRILADLEKDEPKLYALIEMSISERSEERIKKCTEYDTYSGAKDPLPLLLYIIQAHQLAPTGDPLVDEDAPVQVYQTMKQNPA